MNCLYIDIPEPETALRMLLYDSLSGVLSSTVESGMRLLELPTLVGRIFSSFAQSTTFLSVKNSLAPLLELCSDSSVCSTMLSSRWASLVVPTRPLIAAFRAVKAIVRSSISGVSVSLEIVISEPSASLIFMGPFFSTMPMMPAITYTEVSNSPPNSFPTNAVFTAGGSFIFPKPYFSHTADESEASSFDCAAVGVGPG